MLVSPCFSIIDIGMFLRHWWNLNSQSNLAWSLGVTNGISKPDFCRLLFAAIYVVFLYFPLTLFIFVRQLRLPLRKYSWATVGDYRQTRVSYRSVVRVDWTSYCNYPIFGLGYYAKRNGVLQELCQMYTRMHIHNFSLVSV